MGGEAAATHRTVTRRADEPRLEIGDKIPIEEGVVGVVLARYILSGKQKQVCYVVELVPDDKEKARSWLGTRENIWRLITQFRRGFYPERLQKNRPTSNSS